MKRRFSPPLLQTICPDCKQAMYALASLFSGVFFVVVAAAFIQSEGPRNGLPSDPDKVFRVCKWITAPDGSRTESFKMPGLLATELDAGLDNAIEGSARMMIWPEEVPVTNFEQNAGAKRWAFGDPNLLGLFAVQFLYGSAEHALATPGRVVLTERFAQRLFGSGNPVGKKIMGLGGKLYEVSGVVKNPAPESALQFDLLASWASTQTGSGLYTFGFLNNWTAQLAETFVRLQDAGQAGKVEKALREFAGKTPNPAACSSLFLRPVSGKNAKTSERGRQESSGFTGGSAASSGVYLMISGNTY